MQEMTLFGYLMEKKWITSEEAAAVAGTEVAEIESWMTYKNDMYLESSTAEKLARLLYESADIAVLDSVLERITPDSLEYDPETQIELLSKALSMKWNEPVAEVRKRKDKQIVPIKIYLPQCNERVPSSIKAFWELAESVEGVQEIHITDWGVFALDHMEQAAFQYMADKMISASKRGSSIHILTPEADEYPDGKTLLKRLPLYLNENITYYRMQRGTVPPSDECWMTLGMKTVLLVRMLPGEAPVTTLIQEATLAQYYYNKMQMLLAETRPVNQHISEAESTLIYTRMKSDVHPLMTAYFFESVPSFLHMPPKLLREVLETNGAEEPVIEKCQKMSMLRASVRNICRCVQIYNGDHILELLQQEKYADPVLSGMLGKQAYITCEQLKKQLRFFLSETEHTNYTMYLPSFEMDLRLSQCGVSMSVQEDSMTAVVDLSHKNRSFYTTDLATVGGFAGYIERLQRMIPPVKKNGSWTRRLLKRYIQL